MARRNPKRSKQNRHFRGENPRLFNVAGFALLFLLIGAVFVQFKQDRTEDLPADRELDEISPAREWDGLVQIATEQVRHFKGDPNAPVTILEFSDFQ